MAGPFTRFSGLIAGRPRTALAALIIVTIALASGVSMLGPQAGNEVFLPNDSEVADASNTLTDLFPNSAGLINVTVLHRGDAITPEGLAQIDNVITSATSLPDVAERLALTSPVVSLANIYKQELGVSDLSTTTQAQINTATANLSADPVLGTTLANLSGEASGTTLAISQIRLRAIGDVDSQEAAELLIADAVTEVEGPLSVRSLSPATTAQESEDSLASTLSVLLFIALLVIALLLLVFFRKVSDVLLSMAGLGITVIGTTGFQGWAGPDGLGIIGLPNPITTIVPIMLTGLIVDYAIQSVAHYREQRASGAAVRESVQRGLRGIMLPLGLAAVTTIVSFLTNIVSPIPANKDFGIVAAFGVFFGLLTMLVLVPAARSIIDQRRQAKGKLTDVRLMKNAIPGAGKLVERIGGYVSHSPMVVLGAAAVITIGLGIAATGISTEFSSNDFLPTGGESLQDVEDLDEALGGQTEVVTVLIEAELTDDRTLRNLLSVADAFNNELTLPTGAVGGIALSLGDLATDWQVDSGEPGDKYDPTLVRIADDSDQGLAFDPVGINAFLVRLEALDPVTFEQVAVNNKDGIDHTLIQFNALTGDQDRTEQMIADLEGLWFGDRSQITATSGEIISLEVTSAMTEAQSSSIIITIVAALIVLMLFFWFTEFKPMLAVIAVFPIVLVLVWVLGTMALLGIPYNIITALITALSIGIGVDYTIHVIHRFTEEIEHGRSLIDATKTTLGTTGSALIGSALTTALGFAVLLASPLVPFQQFGIVTGITILFALIASIIVVPPMMIVWAAYHQWRAQMAEASGGITGAGAPAGGSPVGGAAPAGTTATLTSSK